MKNTKGFKYGRKSKFKLAKDALRHARTYAYRDRKAMGGFATDKVKIFLEKLNLVIKEVDETKLELDKIDLSNVDFENIKDEEKELHQR